MPKILFTGGGSGGHIYPNLAVIEELKNCETDYSYVYAVSKGSREEQLAVEEGLEKLYIPFIGGMPRSVAAVFWVWRLIWATFVSISKLLESKPDLIYSTGGYASAGIIFAARILSIPYVIHNLDACMGLSNRVFLSGAKALTLGFKPAAELKYNSGPIMVTGNPVRKQLLKTFTEEERIEIKKDLGLNPNLKTILITGGSQGSHSINTLILQNLQTLIDNGFEVIHQLGSSHYEKLLYEFIALKAKCPDYHPCEYLDDIYKFYGISDFIIGRAGAMTLAEIIAEEKPALIIPLPNLAQNHQYHNAKALADRGLILMEEQSQLEISSKLLIKRIEDLQAKESEIIATLREEKENCNAAQQIANLIEDLV